MKLFVSKLDKLNLIFPFARVQRTPKGFNINITNDQEITKHDLKLVDGLGLRIVEIVPGFVDDSEIPSLKKYKFLNLRLEKKPWPIKQFIIIYGVFFVVKLALLIALGWPF